MTLEEYKDRYPNLPEHFYKSAYDLCPWIPECPRGKAFMLGYLDRCWETFKGKGGVYVTQAAVTVKGLTRVVASAEFDSYDM